MSSKETFRQHSSDNEVTPILKSWLYFQVRGSIPSKKAAL